MLGRSGWLSLSKCQVETLGGFMLSSGCGKVETSRKHGSKSRQRLLVVLMITISQITTQCNT